MLLAFVVYTCEFIDGFFICHYAAVRAAGYCHYHSDIISSSRKFHTRISSAGPAEKTSGMIRISMVWFLIVVVIVVLLVVVHKALGTKYSWVLT